MSIFDNFEIVIRCDSHPDRVPPLGVGRATDADGCDIIDENGEPVFLDQSAQSESVCFSFGPRDVAVLVARDRSAGLMIVRIQVAETARPGRVG